MNSVQQFEQEQIAKLTKGNPIPEFAPGDTLKVMVKVVEGDRERSQAYEGVCIARKNSGINSSFTVRKISFGEGVERVFPLYSPNIKIEVVRRGVVRRAKLYYLRDRSGKSARIAEKTTYAENKTEGKSGVSAATKAKKQDSSKKEAPAKAKSPKAEAESAPTPQESKE